MYRLLLLILLLSTHNLIAQSIKGVVLDETGNPLSAATVSLLRAKDSTPQKLEVTDAQGRFSITISKEESYLLCASSVGYTKACSGTLILTQASSEQIKLQLEKQSTALRGVTVSARRPLVEVKADKMVVNVEGTINSIGTTALEVLRKAPGVNLDNDDNISISGKSGVQVYIDGRLSPLSGTDLSGYLSSLQSAQIEAIEIITNPSARYEAAGNGGIINIRLKKNKAFGTNGSVNAGYGIGRYSKYNGGFSLNYRNRWFNIFSTYTYANNRNLISTRTYRILADTIFDQKAKRVVTDKPHNIQAGVDYFINQKSVLGFLVNALPGRIVFDNTSTTPIQPVGATTPYRTLEAAGLNKNKRTNTSMNLNYRFSTTDREFNADADYAHFSA